MKASVTTFRFGEFTLNTRNHCLVHAGRAVYLRPKTYDILLYLLEHHGRLVGKGELLDAVWGDVEVTENVLSQCVKEVRSALADDAQTPRFLKTIPRIGFEFAAEVEAYGEAESGDTIQEEVRTLHIITTEEDGDAISREPTPAQVLAGPAIAGAPALGGTRRGTLGGVYWAIALVAVLVGGAALAVHFRGWREWLPGGAQPKRIVSLGVLPLENLTGDPQQEYFADGMTEELITNLGRVKALRVISRTSVMRYKKTEKSLPEIAKELQVDAVVEGAVERAGNHIRITAQLIDGATDRHLWAQTYDGDISDVLFLQSQVARAITEEIQAEATPEEMYRPAGAHAVNPEAYALYLQGMDLESRDNEPDNRVAMDVLQHAVAIDPNFAPAYAALGRAFSARLFSWEAKDEWDRKAEAAVEKALSLDPDLAEAHASLAALLFTPAHSWDYEGAIRECRRALALNPNLADAHLTLGVVLFHIGLLDEAREELQTAAQINPTDSLPSLYIGFTLMFAGRWQEALPFLNTYPNTPFSKTLQAVCLWELGRKEEAWKIDRELLAADPQEQFVFLAALHTLLLADAGQTRDAERHIPEILRQGESLKAYGHFHHLANFVAIIYAQLNKPDLAVSWLEKTAGTGFPCYPSFEKDRGLDPIRQNPRFVAFMEKRRSQWLTFKSTYGAKIPTGIEPKPPD
ncbi:MAG TPA: winged helix-turn-helix domain-containing protein [Terracidiphilus sp.]|nr:winged helix-turn-helix domain-containing protein [Terracidiphilus sp.]